MAGPFVKLPRDLSLVGLIDRLNLQFQRQFAQSTSASTVSPTVGEILTTSLWFDPDNTFDIGFYVDGTGTSDLRPKSIYAGTKMRAPLFQADTEVTAPTGTFTAVAGTLTTASQPNVTTMANLTTIGTLVAGNVPASRVSAGTFGSGVGSGNYVFPGLLNIDGDQIIVGRNASTFALVDLNAASTAATEVRYKVAGVVRMVMRVAATTPNWLLYANDSGGVFQDTIIQANNAANGGVSINRPVVVGVIGGAAATTAILATRTLTGGITQIAFNMNCTYDSTGTGTGYGVRSRVTTQAAAFTMANAVAYHAQSVSLGAGSAVTTQYAHLVEAMTGAGTNYAWKSNAGIFEVNDILRWQTDNASDIGAAGATRPRTGYFGTSLVAPILDSGTTTDLLLKRNAVTRLTLGSADATLVGDFLNSVDNTEDIGASGASRFRAAFLGSASVMGRTLATSLTLAAGDQMVAVDAYTVNAGVTLTIAAGAVLKVI